MEALSSAFFHQVSSASRIRVPLGWMAKSISVVVPPNAAAFVPVSKSSLDVVPPKGMSRWVWTSMPPGSSSIPVASMTVSRGSGRNSGAISLMRFAFDQMSAGRSLSTVTTVPLRISM